MPNNKYNQLKRQYSLDGGLTWHDLLPMVYKVGNVIETNSNCTDSDGCRWVVLPITEAYDCDSNYNMYQIEAEECLNEFGNFVRSGNIRRYRLIEDYSLACGYSGPICTPTSITSYSYDIVYNGGEVEWNEVATPVVYKITTISDIDKGCNETSSSNRNKITDYTISYSPSGDNTTEEERTVTATVVYEGQTIGSFNYIQKGKICEPSTSITYTNYVITYNGGEVEWNEVATPVVTATENTTITNSNCDETTTTASTEITDYSISYSPSGDNTTTEDRLVTATITHNENNGGNFSYNQKGLFMAEPTLIGEMILKGDTSITNKSYSMTCASGYGNGSTFNFNSTDDGNNEYTYTANDFNEISCSRVNKISMSSVNDYVYQIISFPDTSKITSFYSLFYSFDNKNMKSLNLTNFNTSNAVNMEEMFKWCDYLETLNLSGWDVSKVTNFNQMFSECANLIYLDLSGWEISSDVTGTTNVFSGCTSLKTIVMNNSSCESINRLRMILSKNQMLQQVSIITNTTDCEIGGNCSDNTDCGNMLVLTGTRYNYQPTNIYLNNNLYQNVFSKVNEIDIYNSLFSVDISTLSGALPLTSTTDFLYRVNTSSNRVGKILCFPDVSNVTDMGGMFYDSNSGLVCINAKGWNTSNVTNMNQMFALQTKLSDIIGIEDWDVSNVTDMGGMFHECKSLTSLDLSKWDMSNVTTQYVYNVGMFGESGLRTLLLPKNINNITDFRLMFGACFDLTSIDVTSIDTTKATSLAEMFSYCTSLTDIIGIEDWNVSNVTDMSWVFNCCVSLTTLNLSGWNTSNVTNMNQMFAENQGGRYGESKLTEIIGIEDWNVSNVTNMSDMFFRCVSLTSLDLSKWNTSKVTDMSGMFRMCYKLQTLNLSGWNMNNVYRNSYMFSNCDNLTTIYAYNCDSSTISKLNSAKPSNCTLVY